MRLFKKCKHNWELLYHYEIASQLDVLKQNHKTIDRGFASMLTRKYITDYQCEKCGKFKRLIEKTEN